MAFDYSLRADVKRAAWVFFPSAALLLVLLLIVFSSPGCAGLQKTAQEPLHAESGTAITAGKVPIVGVGSWGGGLFGGGVPQVVINRYDYAAQPVPTPPGAPPVQTTAPTPPSYPTVYSSAWDDPTLVVLNNQSSRFVRVSIDGKPEFRLLPYQATADLHLGLGEHRVQVVVEKQTSHPEQPILEVRRELRIGIRPEGRSQIIYIYDY